MEIGSQTGVIQVNINILLCITIIPIVDYNWNSIYNKIYFKNKKDAQAVIDNPNFRAILNVIYKN